MENPDIITVVGARPQFVKAAVVSKALINAGIKEEIIHTGQHYDALMSAAFFSELNIPEPVVNLDAGSGSHGKQTARMLEKIESYILGKTVLPSGMLVYGDTNSTLAGALAASKLHIPVIHVEAGLRSYNRNMPEEINRVLTDHVSELLFCSSEKGVENLSNESITNGVFAVGDVMYDALKTFTPIALMNSSLESLPSDFALLTLHRPANTDDSEKLQGLLNALGSLPTLIFWPVHPRVNHMLKKINLPENIILSEPLSYFDMLQTLKKADVVLTDSGGLQKEAYWMETKCITLRDETEWVETLDGGWNQLTGLNPERIKKAWNRKPEIPWRPLYGNGKASEKIAGIIRENLSKPSITVGNV